MDEDQRLERRLQQFYDRVPDVEDALPFKDYLLKHEDSRMAWYLLGKQYAAKGQEAKANYCYSQAGEIYEAFESKPLPVAQSASPVARKRGKKGWAIAAALVLLAGGIAVPVYRAYLAGDPAGAIDAGTVEPAIPSAQTEGGKDVSAELPQPSPIEAGDLLPGIVSAVDKPDEEGNRALGELLTRTRRQSPLLLVQAVPIGRWNDWLKSGDPIASVEAPDRNGSAAVRWFDPDWCDCKPAIPGKLRQQVAEWKSVQEEKLALASAVKAYRAQFGRMPDSPDALAGDYPSNRLAGWTPSMTEWFKQLSGPPQARRGQIAALASGWPLGPAASDRTPEATPEGEWKDLMEHPLEIVVDKTRHRLAVVSGRVLLRNYAVGLGGDRTPEGVFVITEKVRNPRGKTEGAFGTRGMTLSGTRYGIHGTAEPDSIGKDESLGCIRMAQADLEELYDLVPLGTKVTIAKGGLPSDTRVPPERFRLPNSRNETNPRKVYDWLN